MTSLRSPPLAGIQSSSARVKCTMQRSAESTIGSLSSHMQGRPLKASDLIPLGAVPEEAKRRGGVSVPAAWRGAFPPDKDTPWEVWNLHIFS